MAETAQTTEEKTEEKQEQQDGDTQENSKTQAQPVEFSEAQAGENTTGGSSIDILLDTKVPIIVAIGRTEIPVQRLLQLNSGSVLKLDKPIETPVDLYLKDTKFATGTIVVIDEKFAVTIKEIVGNNTVASPTKQ